MLDIGVAACEMQAYIEHCFGAYAVQQMSCGGADLTPLHGHMQAPAAPVLASVSLSDPSRGSVSPAALAWTTANWQTPQQVMVSVADQVRLPGLVWFNPGEEAQLS